MNLLPLLLAIGIVAPLISGLAAARIQTSLHVHESLRTQLLRNADWHRLAALHAEEKAAENAAVFSSDDPPQSHFNVTKFGGISVIAGLGSPRQSLRLLVSFDSVLTWIVNTTCDANSCPGWCYTSRFCSLLCNAACCSTPTPPVDAATTVTPVPSIRLSAELTADASSTSLCNSSAAYDRSKSQDYRPDGRDFIDTVRGERVYGQYAIDTLTIGDPDLGGLSAIKSVTFGEAIVVPNDLLGGEFAGQLGVAAGTNTEEVHSFIDDAYQQDVIDQAMLTFWLNSKKTVVGSPDGVLTFSDMDDDHCHAAYLTTLTNKDYSFNVTGYTINNVPTNVNLRATIDLSIEQFTASQAIIDKIATAANSVYNETFGVYFVDCKREFNVSIWLSIGGPLNANKLELTQRELIAHPAPQLCILDVKPTKADNTGLVFGRMLARKYCYVQNLVTPIIQFHLAIIE